MPKRNTKPRFKPDYRDKTLSGKPRMNWVHTNPGLVFEHRLILFFAHRLRRGHPERRQVARSLCKAIQRNLLRPT